MARVKTCRTTPTSSACRHVFFRSVCRRNRRQPVRNRRSKTRDFGERAALRELAAQHAALRDRVARCHALADELDAGRIDAAVLLDAVSELRLAFDAHNQFEERLLRSRVLVPGGPGAMRVARTAEDHADDHQSMHRGLASTTSAQLREVLASLCAHLDAEDRGLVARGIRRAAASR